MYEKCPAHIRMIQMVLDDGYFDKTTYRCKVIAYKPEEECIYFLAEENLLPAFSLDGVYECKLKNKDETVACSGTIQERYWNRLGNILKFRIKNGFYKNIVN